VNDENKQYNNADDTASAREVCEHYYAWVSPAGTSNAARLCSLCNQPDPEWLNGITEVTKTTDLPTARYMRNPIYVDAIQVNPGNMKDVAEWCGGSILLTSSKPRVGKNDKFAPNTPFIKVNSQNTIRVRQTMAFAGDWVTKTATDYKVHTDDSFHRNFKPV
jgi:hypothetical protein